MQTSKQYFKNLQILHGALLFGQLSFLGLAYFIHSMVGGDENLFGFVFTAQLIVGILALSSLLITTQVTKSQLQSIKQKTTLKEKLEGYRSALLLKYALLEGPSLFASVCLLLSGHIFFLAMAVLIIVVFFIQKPTKAKTIADLELSHKDQELLQNEEAIVM